jgi:hypothetical protein
VSPAERAVLAASQALELCLSLRRAFAGPRAVEQLRAASHEVLSSADLHLALGLAWAAGDLPLVRAALTRLPAARIATDPALAAFRDATEREACVAPGPAADRP